MILWTKLRAKAVGNSLHPRGPPAPPRQTCDSLAQERYRALARAAKAEGRPGVSWVHQRLDAGHLPRALDWNHIVI
jgi:hypothetical protein